MRIILMTVLLAYTVFAAASDDASAIVQRMLNHERGLSSVSVIEMKIHRPNWQRTMVIKSWTEGDDKSLIRVIEPKKDAGTGNLMIGNNLWSYTPKVNRIIKLPSSMMSQSWLGSDFSNGDLVNSDDILEHYKHRVIAEEQHQGKKVYVIESIPHDDAPVVWGREVIKVREDMVLLEHVFYDQDDKQVKMLKTLEIKNFDGRLVAATIRMSKVEQPDEWTEITIRSISFGEKFPANMFTLSNLRNPRL